ncbi:hypothetical protein QF205_03105 [Luteimonas composti]|uniref:RiboL-PSP-HEPN domain-containing protein n=1 Tax=Luteimonas composti TaxID=398257 RepID=A0ABT6MPN7_9GAMM|nr:hypothetical protein [Luteimonas composti]MDH7452068.1 hypothetical protein [Luteimonas composti]
MRAKKGELPDWVTRHYEEALQSHQNLMQVASISRKGIHGLTAGPRLMKAVARATGKQAPDQERLRLAEEDASLSESEIRDDFPVLHSLVVVGLWSWLEHLVKEVAINWVRHRPSVLLNPPFNRVRLQATEVASLTRAEQAALIVDLLEQETSSSSRQGVGRFESLLSPMGLSGPVPEDTSKAIFELQQARNVIAHRNGRCDRRFKAACPCLKVKLGAPLRVGTEQVSIYAANSVNYGLELLYRIGDAHELDLRERSDGT